MADYDPRPEGEFGEPDAPLFTRRGRRAGGMSTLSKGLIAGAVLLLVAAAGWFWLRSGEDPEAGAPATDTIQATTPAPAPTDTAADDTAARPFELPPLEASDSLVRRQARELSGASAWSAWLERDGIVQDFVAAVVSVAAGSSPAEHLEFLAPDAGFRVRDVDGRTVIDPASYDRYDFVAETFASLDARATARLYGWLRPLFREAHARLGVGDRSFDQAVADAVGRLLAVEVPDGPVEVVAEGGVWAFRDPDLEALSPAAKHLLRMGPENARRVQAKLRELADAMGIDGVAPSPT